jgi:hypothetical protein
MPVWVSEWETEGRTNMAKEVVEKKYAGCNIFLPFSSSSHLFFPVSSLAVLVPSLSDVRVSHWLTHRAISLTLSARWPFKL